MTTTKPKRMTTRASRILSFCGAWGLASCFPYAEVSDGSSSCACDSAEVSTTLGADHPGWGDPGCWTCHATSRTHNEDMDPYQCADCHGSNGASSGHGATAGCEDCHGQPHGAAGFPDPESCLACHP